MPEEGITVLVGVRGGGLSYLELSDGEGGTTEETPRDELLLGTAVSEL